jgi:hypothetical protein
MTERANRASYNAVSRALGWAVDRSVIGSAYWDVNRAVKGAMNEAVYGAVRGAVFQSLNDQSHPALKDFLGEAR